MRGECNPIKASQTPLGHELNLHIHILIPSNIIPPQYALPLRHDVVLWITTLHDDSYLLLTTYVLINRLLY